MPTTRKIRVNRGEPLVLPIVLTLDGMDWTGVAVDASVFVKDPAIQDQAPLVELDPVVEGLPLTGTLKLSGDETVELPSKCFLWVRAQRVSPEWGPHTSDAVELDVRNAGEPGDPSLDVESLTVEFPLATLNLTFPTYVQVDASGGEAGVPDGDKGEILVSGSGEVWTINDGVVSTDKMGGDVTAAGKALLDDPANSDQRTTLGLGGAAVLNVGITAGTVAAGDDSRFGAGGPPSGAAGGDLTGTYPAPTVANGAITIAKLGGDITAAGKTLLDDADNVAQRGTLGLGNSATLNVGTTAGTVAAGDDSRMTNSRSPSGAATGSLAGTYPAPTLAATGVTAAAYTNANITVAADGRITLAANGSGGGGASYVLFPFGSTTYTPADGVTIYYGSLMSQGPRTIATQAEFVVPVTGTVVKWWVKTFVNSAGSAEAVNYWIRNNTTATDFGNMSDTWDAQYADVESGTLSVAVTAGDRLVVKVIQPTWGTNPGALLLGGWILVEVP
jgi:hypothetical protein